jgi:hypothetical protein
MMIAGEKHSPARQQQGPMVLCGEIRSAYSWRDAAVEGEFAIEGMGMQ